MTYKEFSETFLLDLARSYRNGKIPFHALVDKDLWQRIFLDNETGIHSLRWYNIKINPYLLSDSESSLLIVFSIPIQNLSKETKFIGMRFNSNRSTILFYSLCRPHYVDEAWDIFQYDFERSEYTFVSKIHGTDSLREFRNNIERIPFREKPSIFERVLSRIINKR